MSTSCSTSPRADRAPGWNPPAFGFNVDVVVVDDDEADAVFTFDPVPALLLEEVDRRRGREVDEVVTGDERALLGEL